jgi:hypothetical protein
VLVVVVISTSALNKTMLHSSPGETRVMNGLP